MEKQIADRQLHYLFFYSFVILFVGMGLMPVLPLYATSFGASSSITGLYLSVIYISITLSTILTDWLGLKLGRKRLYIISAALGTPALALMGQANALWQVVVLTAVVWFSGGICMALVNVFTGLFAASENRGKWFSIISLGSPLGAIVGGLTVGGLIEVSVYSLMFIVLSMVWATAPLVAAVKLVDLSAPASRSPELGDPPASTMRRERVPLFMLMGAILLSMTTVNIGRLVVPLLMDSLQYSAGEVTIANAIAGMVTLPFAYFLGTLSDRLGRKTVLSLGYLLAGGSVVILVVAGPLWHFWLATSLLMIALTVTGSVASAFATDLLSPQVLVRVLPWFSAVGFVAGINGFSVASVLIDSIGMTALLGFTTVLALLACAMIWPLHCEKQIAALFEPAWTCDISMRATK